jgi:hypothetical protein
VSPGLIGISEGGLTRATSAPKSPLDIAANLSSMAACIVSPQSLLTRSPFGHVSLHGGAAEHQALAYRHCAQLVGPPLRGSSGRAQHVGYFGCADSVVFTQFCQIDLRLVARVRHGSDCGVEVFVVSAHPVWDGLAGSDAAANLG